MRIRSCIVRYGRYMLVSAACSVFSFFAYSNANLNMFRLMVVSSALFIIANTVDSYIFESYFGKKKHFKFGIAYPYAMFMVTTYILYYIIKGYRWNYLFLPFEVFTSWGMTRLASLTIMHLAVILSISIFAIFGKMQFYKND